MGDARPVADEDPPLTASTSALSERAGNAVRELNLDPSILTAFPHRGAFAMPLRLTSEGSPSECSPEAPDSAPGAETLASSGGSRLSARLWVEAP